MSKETINFAQRSKTLQTTYNRMVRQMVDELATANPLSGALRAGQPERKPLSKFWLWKWEWKTRFEYAWEALKGNYGSDY